MRDRSPACVQDQGVLEHKARSCIVCRKRSEKDRLWRFVLEDGKVVWDPRQISQARGAYIHPQVECVGQLGERRLWEHAFRLKKNSLDTEQFLILLIELKKHLPEIADGLAAKQMAAKQKGRTREGGHK